MHKAIRKQRKFTEHEYRKHKSRKVLLSEHLYFVQICPVFAGPVTLLLCCLYSNSTTLGYQLRMLTVLIDKIRYLNLYKVQTTRKF